MPLPDPKTPWPPPQYAANAGDVAAWSAWWGGDPDELSQHYGGTAGVRSSPEQRGGLSGAVQRMFWGQRTPAGEQRSKLHMPLAHEIAQVSADMLFGAPPTIRVTRPEEAAASNPTQQRIEDLLGEEVHDLLYDAAESCAALGHVYLRVGWDRDLNQDGPILSEIDADMAFPTYRHRVLTEVMFLSEWVNGNEVMRHLEHHEPGAIEHALYVGTHDNIGRRVPITERPELVELAADMTVLDDGRHVIETGVDMLDVVGVRNARARRGKWRRTPGMRDVGRSDIAGLEGPLDALDDQYSSWMRDIRHGRSRLHVPQHYMKSLGPGQGAVADIDRELYVQLNAMVDTNGGLQIDAQQFAIRWQEHRETTLEFIARITSGAGYSPQTFGISEVTALTATESWNRQIRTQNTRQAKIRRWRPALRQLAPLMLAFDQVHFNGGGDPELAKRADVVFQESIAESLQGRAQTAQLMRGAEAASTETLVRLLHPDWDATQVQQEVERITDETPAPPPSPFEFGGGPDGDTDNEDDADADPFGSDSEDDDE